MQCRGHHAQKVNTHLTHALHQAGLSTACTKCRLCEQTAFRRVLGAHVALYRLRPGSIVSAAGPDITWLGLPRPSEGDNLMRLIRRLTARAAAGHSTALRTERRSAWFQPPGISTNYQGGSLDTHVRVAMHSPDTERSIHILVSVSLSALPSCFSLRWS